jgi:hypothetical protein
MNCLRPYGDAMRDYPAHCVAGSGPPLSSQKGTAPSVTHQREWLSQRFQLLPAPTTAQKQLFGGTAAMRRSFRYRLTDPTLGNRASQISLHGRALAFEADMETKT